MWEWADCEVSVKRGQPFRAAWPHSPSNLSCLWFHLTTPTFIWLRPLDHLAENELIREMVFVRAAESWHTARETPGQRLYYCRRSSSVTPCTRPGAFRGLIKATIKKRGVLCGRPAAVPTHFLRIVPPLHHIMDFIVKPLSN